MTPKEHAWFRVLQPEIPQRELAKQLGISMGKANYLINALLEKGLIKIESFHRTEGKLNKIAYLLTPEGVKNRMQLTRSYLARKEAEYEALKKEIEGLRKAEMDAAPALAPKRQRGVTSADALSFK